MIRVGFTGTNWTGKTRTISEVVEIQKDISLEIVKLSKFVAECPFPMKEKQTLEGSQWMVEQMRNAMNKKCADLQIFDRTPLDILAFTFYAQRRTATSTAELTEDILNLAERFDCIFYLKPSENWPVGVHVSPEQIDFAKKMDTYIQKAMEQSPIQVIELPWEMNERVRIVSEYLLNVPQLKG